MFSEEAIAIPQFFGLARRATVRRVKTTAKQPTDTLVLCARKSCFDGPRFSECDCFRDFVFASLVGRSLRRDAASRLRN